MNSNNETITYELPQKHFPFAPLTEILARDREVDCWHAGVFLLYDSAASFPYITKTCCYTFAIPLAGNEHLLGKNFPAGTPAPPAPPIENSVFMPFDRVLMRDAFGGIWNLAHYGYYTEYALYPHCAVSGVTYRYCIPYEGNENLHRSSAAPTRAT